MTEPVRAPKTPHHIDQLKKMMTGEAPLPPIARLIGFTIVHVELN